MTEEQAVALHAAAARIELERARAVIDRLREETLVCELRDELEEWGGR